VVMLLSFVTTVCVAVSGSLTCYCSYHLGFFCVLLGLESSCLVCGYIIGALLLSIS
jgi:hypothetical protein